ncbi:MAG: DUF5666 domain-containing protein [Nitrospira sp.]|nr:DUF5666 domain-containing protein [Nitrospira sp.]
MIRHLMVRHLIMAALVLFCSATAFAHGSGQHVLGTVAVIDRDHIQVKTPKGETVTVKLTKETRFKEKGNPNSTELPVAGDRVVIDAIKEKKALIATEVHFSAAKKAAAAAVPAPAPAQ